MSDKIFCPHCGIRHNQVGRALGKQLECVESNYSGTGADVMSCPSCGRHYFVSYAVKEIVPAPDWDDEEEIARLAKEKTERTATALLRRIVKGSAEESASALELARQMLAEKDEEYRQ